MKPMRRPRSRVSPASSSAVASSPPTQILPAAYTLDGDGVTVEIGGLVVGSFHPAEPGVRVKERESWLHEVRARREVRSSTGPR